MHDSTNRKIGGAVSTLASGLGLEMLQSFWTPPDAFRPWLIGASVALIFLGIIFALLLIPRVSEQAGKLWRGIRIQSPIVRKSQAQAAPSQILPTPGLSVGISGIPALLPVAPWVHGVEPQIPIQIDVVLRPLDGVVYVSKVALKCGPNEIPAKEFEPHSVSVIETHTLVFTTDYATLARGRRSGQNNYYGSIRAVFGEMLACSDEFLIAGSQQSAELGLIRRDVLFLRDRLNDYTDFDRQETEVRERMERIRNSDNAAWGDDPDLGRLRGEFLNRCGWAVSRRKLYRSKEEDDQVRSDIHTLANALFERLAMNGG